MYRVLKWLDKYMEEVPLVIFLFAIVFFSGAQVFMRYVMNASLAWSDALSRYAFVWSGFIAISYSYKTRSSLRIDVILRLLPRKIQSAVEILVNLLCMALFALLAKVSYDIILETAVIGQVSSAVQIPMQFIYASPLVGFAATLIRLVLCTVEEFKVLLGKEAIGEDQTLTLRQEVISEEQTICQ